ncbi:MAG: 3-dehydroquinate synthase [Betaproteobacteria bacterium]|nr:3-dehydroquinate synthase [Betaproteobacteria bacterium]
MKTLSVDLFGRAYPIHIGSGLMQDFSLIKPHLQGQQVMIVSNDKVAPLYLSTLKKTLMNGQLDVHECILPDGEVHKNFSSYQRIVDALVEARFERRSTVIALGGGVIGDLTGFAAATFLRGVSFIQIPTTLLSQVDSSVGGKTGINHELGKNLIGAFHQPRLVLADTDTLTTLPDREYRAGLAEVIKYGFIRDAAFMSWLEEHTAQLNQRDPAILTEAIYRSCQNKAQVVAEDEYETTGIRALLNFGHTFGHAIETGMGYGTWLHGEAVAAGMLIASALSQRLGLISSSDLQRVINLSQALQLPHLAPDLGVDRYLSLMSSDKKVEAGKIRYVVLKSLGQAMLCQDIPEDIIRQLLSRGSSPFIGSATQLPV